MVNLYCPFKGSRARIFLDFKKQLVCSHVIAAQEYTYGKSDNIKDTIHILAEFAESQELNTRILPGYLFNCDFFIPDAPDVLKKILDREYTLASSRYLLVQLHKQPSFLQELISEMGRFGIVMVQLHNLKKEENGKDNTPLGMLHMLKSEDITGRNGKHAKKTVFEMIKDGLVSFVGGVDIAKAYQVVEENFGPDTAESLFITNPRKVIMDELIY
ncbi:MAG: hypothetical protein GX166_05845 [Clostridiaceae bacterium]|nr:hypothetical protein [Clostridiaceae bacterium]